MTVSFEAFMTVKFPTVAGLLIAAVYGFWLWRRHVLVVCSSFASTARDPDCSGHWPIQSRADERTRDHEYLYKLHANRNDIHGSGRYARVPIE
jgi:hypothetical protein